MQKSRGRVAVGLSGGVDSAVSAYLLKQAGYEVTGVHLVCWDEGPKCKAREDRLDAVKVALKLEIPIKILDFQKEYKERVIDRFYADYEKGLTPNPDIWCNSEIKFGLFLGWAVKNGFDYVATGHYAKVDSYALSNNRQTWSLIVPRDKHKDQTYFLYRLTQRELAHVLFPLGDLLKSKVREIAKKIGLPVAEKPDSQGICFIGEVDIHDFLRRRLREQEGDVVVKIPSSNLQVTNKSKLQNSNEQSEFKVIGRHKGVWFYTIGQRGGWEIAPEAQRQLSNDRQTIVKHGNTSLNGHLLPPMYVVEKDVENNRLVVGFGAETYREKFVVGDLSWVNRLSEDQRSDLRGVSLQVMARVRHGGELLRAKLQITNYKLQSEDKITVWLESPQRGIAPGQAAVLYRQSTVDSKQFTECLGGGVLQ